MGKQVTRIMADTAAKQLAQIAYGKKIEEAEAAERKLGDEMIKKYIPAAIIACMNEFPQFFSSSASFGASDIESTKSCGNSWTISSNDKNPVGYNHYVPVSHEDYLKIKAARDLVKSLWDKSSQYVEDVSNALVTLRSEKRVKEQFPEALPYLGFCDTTALVPQYTNLRSLLNNN